jgi:hypothetical protein
MTDPTGAPATDGGTASNANEPPTGQAPKWDGEFNQERAEKLVANLRADMEKLKAARDAALAKIAEREDAEKSELQKLQERAAKSEEDLSKAQRALAIRDAADEFDVPKRLRKFISGSTAEEIAASAKELAEEIGSGGQTSTPALPGRPAARLVPGHGGNSDAAAFDADAVAKAARSR